MVLGTIGLHRSRKIGTKYLLRGIRLIVIIAAILIVIMSIGMMVGSGGADNYINEFLNAISSNPAGGEYMYTITQEGVTGQVNAKWGLGLGGILLLISGIILLIAGILEIIDNKEFFKPKQPIESKKKRKEKPPEASEDK